MLQSKDFKGCKAIIRDEDDETMVVETAIEVFDRHTLTALVSSRAMAKIQSNKVTLLLFRDERVYEFKGTVRRAGAAEMTEIAMYKGKEKEERGSMRYSVNVPARIESLIVSNKAVRLKFPLEASARNISKSGVLLLAKKDVFTVGTTFQLTLNIAGSETVLNTFVVRERKANNQQAEYGCIFFSPGEELPTV